MQVYSGKSVFRGIAIGKISVYRKNEQQVKRVRTENTKGELARYEAAKAAAIEQLQDILDTVKEITNLWKISSRRRRSTRSMQ